jgi:hypothetical protein
LIKVIKLLALTQLTTAYSKFPGNYDLPRSWAKPSLGRLGIAQRWVIEVRPIPLMASNCYGKVVMYVDMSLRAPLAEDLYDGKMSLSKIVVLSSQSADSGAYGMQTWAAGGILRLRDIVHDHATMGFTADEQGPTWPLDSAVKPQYSDIREFQTASGPGGADALKR